MASTGLSGPFDLDLDTIDRVVTKKSAGAYAVGNTADGVFYVSYVGRADYDLNDRLKDHVGTASEFKADYFSSAEEAFEKECRLYHDFSTKRNKVHPARPKGSNATCPCCTIFD